MDLWSGLPFEILQQVLSFVSLPDLCRYGTVCKAWNHLISDLRFVAVYAQNASKRESDKMSFIVTRVSEMSTTNWSVLDLNAKRWYRLDSTDECVLTKYSGRLSVGMGGGLVCEYVENRSTKVRSITVRNLIANTAKVLPTAPISIDHDIGDLRLALNTSTSDNFKVILFYGNFDMGYILSLPLKQRRSLMYVYNSATNEWKGMKNPTWSFLRIIMASSILKHTIFQGSMYFLFSFDNYYESQLWRINLVEDVWERLMYVPGRQLELIVSANRLFLGQIENRVGMVFYILTEIKVSERTKQMVLDHSKAKRIELLGADPEFWYVRFKKTFRFGSSLIFMSETSGEMMSFDMARGTWDREWPQNPLRQLLQNHNNSWRGEHMNLLLPNCTIW